MKPPIWAIVGRPNVGKSTLFNRLVGARAAVVSPARGTTRDRLYGRLVWRGRPLTVIDTGGLELAPADRLAAAVQQQVRQALDEATGMVLVCDGQAGLLPADELLADALRRIDRPLLLAVNKLDGAPRVPPDFFRLGFEAFPLSALHGRGIGELLDRLAAGAPEGSAPIEPAARIALVGRQNVGKSSLFNALLREERAIVHERPGTTRDTLTARLHAGGRPLEVLDTAGLRHRRKVRDAVDVYSMARSVGAIERCDVAVLVLDATQGVTRDDKRIAARIADAGRALLVAANKWDLAPRGMRPQAAIERIRRLLPQARYVPVLAVSAKTGYQVPQTLTAAARLLRLMQHGLPPEVCEALVQSLWRAQPPPRVRGRLLSLRAVSWQPGHPPMVELAVAPPLRPPDSYQRYLVHGLMRDPRLAGVPLRLRIRGPRRVAG